MKYTISSLLSLIILFTVLSLFAGTDLLKAQNGKGKISGLVSDSKSNLPVQAADISLMRIKDSTIVTGASTDEAGKFLIEDVSFGRYKILIRMIGYKPANVNGIFINDRNSEVNLDTIKIIASSEIETDVIEIESEKSMVEFRGDKKIFNVGDDISNAGGNALDVLKNIPSILVDVEGNVSLRGTQNIKIMVDGKQFGLEGSSRNAVLQQIPATSIESVELITNPSAKYDPEGTSGILNIILKKKSGFGYNGSININAGTADKYNGGINLNMKSDKFNYYLGYNYTDNNNTISGSSYRQNLFPTESVFINQLTNGNVKSYSNLIKGGIEYNLNPKNSLSLNLNYVNRKSDRSESNNYDYLSINYDTVESYITNNFSTDDGYNFDLSLNYNGKFKSPKQTLYGEITYSNSNEEDIFNSFETFFIPVNATPGKLNNYENDKSNLLNLQLDYEMPLGKETKLETGYRGIFRKNDNDFRSESFDYNLNFYVPDLLSSNRYIYDENINAVYGIYSGSVKDFNYSFGLRSEYTSTNGRLEVSNAETSSDYFNVFPSASLSQKLSASQEIQLTYSRRINRPNIRNLNPFVDETDPANIRVGNPFLTPEFTNSYELSYINYFPFAVITPSLFLRNTTDEISRYRFVTDSNVTVTTFLNLNSSYTYGLDLIINSQILKWWNVNGNFSFYQTEVDAENIVSGLVNETNSWSARASTSMNIPDIVDVQVSYFYTGKRISATGTMQPMQSVDLTLNKNLLDNKMSFGFRIADLFNTLKFTGNIAAENYIQDFSRRRNSRTAFLTFTYNFGTKDKSDNRKNKKPAKREREQDGDEGF
ncbi:MAG TPA: TonB-dependent receptor [Ignavibacteria bacterium]|nr:TonB-dependent receptor [Ignavibacteria bacterium]